MEKRKGIGKGTPGPGRPKGLPNATTKATRDAFQMLVDRNFDKLEGWIDEVAKDNPKDAFGMVMDLASFCVPKLKAIEVSGKDGGPMSITITREVITKPIDAKK